jgi:hypothetical protein
MAQLDDPMRPPDMRLVKGSAGSAMGNGFNAHLSSTLITKGQRSAIINGQNVSVGDRVAGAKVIEIMPTEVVLRRKGRNHKVKLLPVSVKKSVNTGVR